LPLFGERIEVTQNESWPRVAVVGAGAVGGYFGGVMARSGASVVMIGRPAFVEAVNSNGLFLDTVQFQETVRVEASTELIAAQGADIVLFCVKTTDTAVTARELASFLAPNTVIVSLQNGVDNVEQIRAASNLEAVGAVVYVAAAVKAPGHIQHFGRGDLVIGPETERTQHLAAQFARCGVPCRVSSNIEGELWVKFIANCALNPVSALGQAKYGRIAASPAAVKLLEMIGDEVLAVAHAAGIVLPGVEDRAAALAISMKIATQIKEQFSSTGQDLNRGKRTEIDSLNGYIARRGAELGVPTPANHALYALVKLAEGR
jgi:2-dehydropantoate 2-reductase